MIFYFILNDILLYSLSTFFVLKQITDFMLKMNEKVEVQIKTSEVLQKAYRNIKDYFKWLKIKHAMQAMHKK